MKAGSKSQWGSSEGTEGFSLSGTSPAASCCCCCCCQSERDQLKLYCSSRPPDVLCLAPLLDSRDAGEGYHRTNHAECVKRESIKIQFMLRFAHSNCLLDFLVIIFPGCCFFHPCRMTSGNTSSGSVTWIPCQASLLLTVIVDSDFLRVLAHIIGCYRWMSDSR